LAGHRVEGNQCALAADHPLHLLGQVLVIGRDHVLRTMAKQRFALRARACGCDRDRAPQR
jgi:hypothetical protein